MWLCRIAFGRCVNGNYWQKKWCLLIRMLELRRTLARWGPQRLAHHVSSWTDMLLTELLGRIYTCRKKKYGFGSCSSSAKITHLRKKSLIAGMLRHRQNSLRSMRMVTNASRCHGEPVVRIQIWQTMQGTPIRIITFFEARSRKELQEKPAKVAE